MSALIGNIYCDVVTRVSPSAPVSVTTHPIENGSYISEHVSELPAELTMDCTFKDASLPVSGGVAASAATDIGLAATAAAKRDAIWKLKGTEIVTVETELKHYPDYLLIDIQEEQTPATMKVFKATLIFQHIEFVTTKSVTVPLDKLKKKPVAKKDAGLKGTPTSDAGKQAPKELTEAERAGILRHLFEQAGIIA
jgi:hypothetical protein